MTKAPNPIRPPDTHHVSAVIGWLELGNPAEAENELRRIARKYQRHPDFLELKWAVYAASKQWKKALHAAERLQVLDPTRAAGWIHHAYSIRRLEPGGLLKARSILLEAYKKFPEESVIPYNLACYAAQLNELKEAWDWIHKAMEVSGDVDKIRRMGLADPDLKPLWEKLKTL
jgi:predicted Zn-dependent protease